MKKYFIALLLLVCILPLTGCLKKDVIDVEKFTNEMEGRGFSVEKTADLADGPKGLKVYYSASKTGINYKAELYVFDGKDSAKASFANQVTNLKNTNSSNYVQTEVNGLNYSTYTLGNDSGYYHMIRVDEKIIYVFGPAEDKGDMKDLVKALGY